MWRSRIWSRVTGIERVVSRGGAQETQRVLGRDSYVGIRECQVVGIADDGIGCRHTTGSDIYKQLVDTVLIRVLDVVLVDACAGFDGTEARCGVRRSGRRVHVPGYEIHAARMAGARWFAGSAREQCCRSQHGGGCTQDSAYGNDA